MIKDFSGQVLADKYKIGSVIRDGGALGTLYSGTHLAMEKPVAVKILAPALALDRNIVERFSDEAKMLSRISHPNILNVTDYGTDKNGAVFTVLEEASGASLKETIKREGKFSPERASRVVRQIAAALSVAHANNVTHSNLTAENVLLTKTATDSDTVKILDFGAARFDGNNALDKEISNTDAEYLAPEQCIDESKADARSDVYALGVILYEMLAGEVPFAAERATDVMLKQAQEPPLPLSAFRTDLPNEVNEVVMTALAKNPDARYQTATDFAAALNRTTLLPTASTEKTFAAPNLIGQPAARAPIEQPHNNIWKTAFIVLAGIAVLSGFIIYTTSVKQTNPPTQLATDANGSPVQPVNPATGTSEQSLSNMGAYSPDAMSGNSNGAPLGGMPQALPGGDGYDPWRNGGRPPSGAPMPQGNYNVPTYIGPGGQQIYIDPNNSSSPFMPPDGRVIIVPVKPNANVNTQANTGVKGKAGNSNTQTAPPNTGKPPTTPAANTSTPAETKPAKPAAKPTPKPAEQPPKSNPAKKTAPSGKTENS